MSITIDLNDALVQRAEQHASSTAQPLAPAVQELYGILSLPADFDYKT